MLVAKPNRVRRSYVQQLRGSVERVFPLLCPVREAEWIPGWAPLAVYSESGVAEAGCVFTTAAEGGPAVWLVDRWRPQDGFVGMLRVTPGLTVCQLEIKLRPAPGGCTAEIAYAHTSLGPRGDQFVADFTEAHFQAFMQLWELRLNHYLETGTLLADAVA